MLIVGKKHHWAHNRAKALPISRIYALRFGGAAYYLFKCLTAQLGVIFVYVVRICNDRLGGVYRHIVGFHKYQRFGKIVALIGRKIADV